MSPEERRRGAELIAQIRALNFVELGVLALLVVNQVRLCGG